MNQKRNYQKELEQVIAGLKGEAPRLLLHSCCARAAVMCWNTCPDIFRLPCGILTPISARRRSIKSVWTSRPG